MPESTPEASTMDYTKVPICDLLQFLRICEIVAPSQTESDNKQPINKVWSNPELATEFNNRYPEFAFEPATVASETEESDPVEEEDSETNESLPDTWVQKVALKKSRQVGAKLSGFLRKLEATLSINKGKVELLRTEGVKNQSRIIGLNEQGEILRKIAQQHADTHAALQPREAGLVVSMSEAVATYIFPEIHSKYQNTIGDPLIPSEIRLERADARFLASGKALENGQIDGAIMWPDELRLKGIEVGAGVAQKEIEGSRVSLCLIFHASHKFAAKSRGQTGQALLELIHEESLHYPDDLPGLRKIATKLVPQTRCLRTGGFPAVVAQVREGIALGLFPAWPHVLERLRVEEQIYSLSLPDNLDGQSLDIWLNAYHQKNNELPRTRQFLKLVKDLENAYMDARKPSPWTPKEWDNPFHTPEGMFVPTWSAYYINRSRGDMPYPRWRRGKWTFSESKLTAEAPYTGEVQAMYHMTRQNESKDIEILSYDVSGVLTNQFAQLRSTPRTSGSETKSSENLVSATINLMRVFERESSSPGRKVDRVVFGFIHTAPKDLATVAPFILCPDSLLFGLAELRNLCNLVEFHTRALQISQQDSL